MDEPRLVSLASLSEARRWPVADTGEEFPPAATGGAAAFDEKMQKLSWP